MLSLRTVKLEQKIEMLNAEIQREEQEISKLKASNLELMRENHLSKESLKDALKQKDVEIKKSLSLNEGLFKVLREKKDLEELIAKLQSNLAIQK